MAIFSLRDAFEMVPRWFLIDNTIILSKKYKHCYIPYMKRFILYISFFVLSIASLTLVAQPLLERDAFVMNHLSTADGLDNMRVFSILQGPQNEMWISSRDGINRYNGSTMVNYHLDSDTKVSNAAGRIISLYQKNKKLYAYDNKGNIYAYNTDLGRFDITYALSKYLQGDIELNRIFIDGTLWLALRRGVYQLKDDKAIMVYNKDRAYDITKMGKAVACALGNGVLIVNGNKKTILKGSEKYNVQTIYYDSKTGFLWLGTLAHGVKVYDYLHHKWLNMSTLANVPENPIRAFTPYDSQTMLVGIDGAGVYKMNRKTLSPTLFLNAEDKTGNALTGNGIYTLCVDRNQNIWVGSYTGGVDVAYPRSVQVEFFQHEYQNSQSLINNAVNDICETSDGTLWLATNIGLSIYNAKTKKWQHTLQNKVLLTLTPNGSSSVFVGTYGNGVYQVSSNGTAQEAYSVKKGNFNDNYVTTVMKDADGDLWIGNIEGQLGYVHNGKATYFPIYAAECLTTLDKDRMVAGTPNGFFVINKRTGEQTAYFTAKEFMNKEVNSFIKSMVFKDKDNIWIGTDGGGVYLYNLKKRQILKNLTTANRLPSNSVAALLQDRKGHLYVSTDKGLSMINTDYTLSNMSMVKGMDQEYNRMACALLKDNRVAFGGNNGAVILSNTTPSMLSYTAHLNINRLTPAAGEKGLSDKTIKKLHDELLKGEINLSFNQNTFELGFECINYRFQHDIQYMYQLEGFDTEWLYMPTLQALRYTNLPPGNYTLHIKAVSKTDGRIIDQKQLEINVAHPWYSSPIAWFIYFLILSSIGWLVWRIYRNKLEKKYYDDKINFFVNTAHDIRTPLSLVLAPLNDMAKDKELSEQSKKFLKMAQRNGDKLMKMVTQLLDIQKYDSKNIKINVQQVALKPFLHHEIERFKTLAKQKKQTITIGSCVETEVWIDQSIVEVILENLISNAIKYTPENGSIEISAVEENGEIALKAKDSGIGIPKKDQKGIFDLFFRATNVISGKETGTGLGLMITRHMAEKMKASLTFESKEGQGTVFTLKPLPTTIDKELINNITTEQTTHENQQSATTNTIYEPKTTKDSLLFVDDNEELRNYIQMAFQNFYNITTVESGEKALDFLQNKGTCDIVVSDVMMPGMQGTELCNHIKENANTSWLPVILLTAKSGKDFMINGLQLGADDYVTKPFDPEILRTKIDSMLQNRRRLSKYYLDKAIAMVQGKTQEVSIKEETTTKEEATTQEPAEINADDQQFINRATQLVIDNISDEDFDINKLCREMAMSRTLFYGKLKNLTGKTPQDFIRLLRLEHAATLLRQGQSVIEASSQSGFSNAKYFSTIFKKHFGISPSQYNQKVMSTSLYNQKN